MSEPTKEELLAFMRKHGPENVDSITDTESAIRHFRCTSKVYKEQRDQYKAENEKMHELNKQLIFENKIHEQDINANNDRLLRRIEYLEKFKRRWEKLDDWKKGKFEEYNKHSQRKAMQSNNDLLHELSYTMNELERDMYKGRG